MQLFVLIVMHMLRINLDVELPVFNVETSKVRGQMSQRAKEPGGKPAKG